MSRGAFIRGEDVARFARWQFAAVGAEGNVLGGVVDPEAIEEARQQGRDEGYAAGRAAAQAEAREQMEAYQANEGLEAAQRVAALLASAEAQLAEVQQELARGTLEIACALARQVLRQEIATRPTVLEPVVREALAMLAVDGKASAVRLSPTDFEMMGVALRAEFEGQPVSVVADAGIAPGDCLVESAGTVIDGGVATRWSRAVAALGLAMPWHDDAAPKDPDAAG